MGGFRDGFGTMIWPDGACYEGEWSYGYPFGRGKFTHVDQELYDGVWKNPFNSGKVTISSDNNSILRDIVNGKRDGYLWLHHKQERLKGKSPKLKNKFSIGHCDKVNDVKKRYDGIVQDLKIPREQLATEFTAEFGNNFEEITYEEQIRYTGATKQGKREGKGRNLWPNGDKYEGGWENDMQNGWGRNLWADGSSYIGHYKDNQKDGIGEYIWEDGTSYFGQ